MNTSKSCSVRVMTATIVIIKVSFLLGDGVNAGLHHRQAFTAFYIVWKLLDTCRERLESHFLENLIKYDSTKKLANISKRAFRFAVLCCAQICWRHTCSGAAAHTVFTDVQLFEVNQAGNGGW